MLALPQLVIEDSTNHYTCRATWITWHPRTYQVAGMALVGPDTLALGASAALMSRRNHRFPLHWSALPEPVPQAPHYLFSGEVDGWTRRTSTVRWAPKHRWTQVIVLPAAVFPTPAAAPTEAAWITHWGDPAQWQDTAWARLQQEPVPLDSAWQAAFFAHREDSPLEWTVLPAWSAPGTHTPTLIHVTGLQHLAEWVATGIRRQWWTIPEGFGPNPAIALPEDATPDQYLTAGAPALGSQLDTLVQPRVTAGSPRPAAWDALGRQPYPAQADVIQAASATLVAQGHMLIVGEQGTGKTLMMATAPWDAVVRRQGRPGVRVLVVAPDHLLPKWRREVLETIPGATATVLQDWRDVLHHRTAWSTPPDHPEYWIIGRDRAKLSYRTHFAGRWSEAQQQATCPDCGSTLADPDTGLAWPQSPHKTAKTRHCPVCRTPLWTADPGLRRISPMHLLRRYAHRRFDCVVFDEVHELKGATEQGQVLAWGRQVGRMVLAGTGTLGSGYADDLHLIQYRLNPKSMLAEDIGHGDLTVTQERYGRVQTVVRTDLDDTDQVYGRRARTRKYKKRLPGVSPLWFATKLVDQTATIRLDDLGPDALPPYEETVQWISMTDAQGAWYRRVVDDLSDLAKAALQRGSQRFLGALVAVSLTLADEPWKPVIVRDGDDVPHIWTPPDTLPETDTYPKETQIVRDVQAELAAGRRVWIYTTFTDRHPQSERLVATLRAAGIRPALLGREMPRDRREAWIAQQVQAGTQVIVSHPQLVETGLDLIAFPTLFWYSTGYNLFRLRQASRRAWRIGQTQPCHVRFYAYDGTMEQTALHLMAEKLEAARALEGDLSLEGLQRLTEQHGSGNDLARSLAHGLDHVVDVSQIWQQAALADPIAVAVRRVALAPVPIALTTVPTTRRMHRNRRSGTPETPDAEPTLQLAWNF